MWHHMFDFNRSKTAVMALSALYCVVFLSVHASLSVFDQPTRLIQATAIRSRSHGPAGGRLSDAQGSSDKGETSSSTAATAGTFTKALPNERSNRRLAHEQHAADLAVWNRLENVRHATVEFQRAGNSISLKDALNTSNSNLNGQLFYIPGLDPGLPPKQLKSAQEAPKAQKAMMPKSKCDLPISDIRIFIGITSRCCDHMSHEKRKALRNAWVQTASEQYPSMVVKFILAQPSSEREFLSGVELLEAEVQQFNDIVVVPGKDVYRLLPNKTLQLFEYAVGSPCNFTHILKTDDDVFVRPHKLMEVVVTGKHNFSVPVQYNDAGVFDGTHPGDLQEPWMRGMYVGQLDSNRSGIFPGFSPNRDPLAKWYLSHEDLPDAMAPLGTRWASGWGYLLSRDLANIIVKKMAVYVAQPSRRPPWWGRLPWEDVMIAAMLEGHARVHHHQGWKAAWQECDKDVVLKHLDNDALPLMGGLQAQELSGLWDLKSIVCSMGPFHPNNYTEWLTWRNSLPDNQAGGYM